MNRSRWCPECGAEYDVAIVACPRCRCVLADEPPIDEPVRVHRVPDAASGALLLGLLEQNGVPAVLRSNSVPGYPGVADDWAKMAGWSELWAPAAQADEARDLIAEYLEALERGGHVRDEDVEGEAPV